MRHDLLANERAAEPLGQIQALGHFVGAVDGDIDDGMIASTWSEARPPRPPAFCDSSEVGMPCTRRPSCTRSSQFSNKERGCRTGSQSDDHAVLDCLECGDRRLSFEFVHHVCLVQEMKRAEEIVLLLHVKVKTTIAQRFEIAHRV